MLCGALGAHELAPVGSDHALRFSGTGSSQQDRVRLQMVFPLEVTFRRESTGVAQAGLEFNPNVPRGALIRSAKLILTAGVEIESPDLSPLIQQVVDRGDWSADNTLGLMLDGTPARGPGWRSFGNFASGTPPRLEVEYSRSKAGPFGLGALGAK